MKLNTVEELIEDIRLGKMVVLMDDEDRENEGDIVMAAQHCRPEDINFMARHARGLICMPMTRERCQRLGLPLMVQANGSGFGTKFTVSIEAATGVTTGISAADRAHTIKLLVNPKTQPADFVAPGHIFPIIARDGGVLVRTGHTEAAVDFARLAGKAPVGVICEIMNEDGTMARLPDLQKFVKKHKLKIGCIADLIRHRRHTESLVKKVSVVKLPTEFGDFDLHCFVAHDGAPHLAMVCGDIKGKKNVLVRVHSECLTGDVFHSARCDCGQQLEGALRMIADEGCGVLVYMRQEGRGIGLVNKLHAYQLQEQGLDTVEANERLGFPADLREYGLGAQILQNLGIKSIRLITNNPRKIIGLEGYGLKISGRVPLVFAPKPGNRRYLKAKKERLGHLL